MKVESMQVFPRVNFYTYESVVAFELDFEELQGTNFRSFDGFADQLLSALSDATRIDQITELNKLTISLGGQV